MKESIKEWKQINSRRLSRDDLQQLRDALRWIRADQGSVDMEKHLDSLGVDWSGLVADFDGDAPDRFDPNQPLDWHWKAPIVGADKWRYHQVSKLPTVGDRVQRPWSDHVGTVQSYVRSGSGFLISVMWDVSPFTRVAMSQLLLVESP